MIAVSSNLATNVLLDFVGVAVRAGSWPTPRITGIDLVRGVEDDRAFEAGISNRVTAKGWCGLLRAILEGRFGGEAYTEEMLGILCAQTFNSGIPAGLPAAIRGVARDSPQDGRDFHRDARRRHRVPARSPAVCPGGLDGSSGTTADRYAPIARSPGGCSRRCTGNGLRGFRL